MRRIRDVETFFTGTGRSAVEKHQEYAKEEGREQQMLAEKSEWKAQAEASELELGRCLIGSPDNSPASIINAKTQIKR